MTTDTFAIFRRTKSPQVIMSRGMCFIIIELGKFNKSMEKLDNTRDEWCFLLQQSDNLGLKESQEILNKGGTMAEAVKHLWNISKDEQLREAAIARDRDRRDRLASLRTARDEGREEGREEGRKEGEEKGRKEGEEKGRKEGEEKGRKEEVEKIALNMIKNNLNTDLICQTTGLSKKEVEMLRNHKK